MKPNANIILKSPGKPSGETESVFAGYTGRDYPCIVLERNDGISLVYSIVDNNAYWGGGLRKNFHDRLSDAEEGETFQYRNKKFVRMTAKEISDLVEGKIFQVKTPPLPPKRS